MLTQLSLIDLGTDRIAGVDPNLIWGLNFHVRRKSLIEHHGFHPDLYPEHMMEFRGDGETGFTKRAAAAGVRADYVEGIAVSHNIGAKRLQLEYIEQVAFRNGVGQAFAEIRGQASNPRVRDNNPKRTWAAKPSSRAHGPRNPKELDQILRQATAAGRNFLRRKYLASRSLQDWVHRDAYWDYAPPN